MEISFGKLLRDMRKRAGMSQEDIALDLHMPISSVSRFETDKYEIKAADLSKWACVTGTQDMMVAFMCGVDIALVQQMLDAATTLVGTIFLGGFYV